MASLAEHKKRVPRTPNRPFREWTNFRTLYNVLITCKSHHQDGKYPIMCVADHATIWSADPNTQEPEGLFLHKLSQVLWADEQKLIVIDQTQDPQASFILCATGNYARMRTPKDILGDFRRQGQGSIVNVAETHQTFVTKVESPKNEYQLKMLSR